MDRIWIVKRAGYFELCLVNVVNGELALRLGQVHLDDPVVHDDDSLVSENSELKCGGRNAIFPDMTGGFALCLLNHVSQLPVEGDSGGILARHLQELREVTEGCPGSHFPTRIH